MQRKRDDKEERRRRAASGSERHEEESRGEARGESGLNGSGLELSDGEFLQQSGY